jgi:hypothetical protein
MMRRAPGVLVLVVAIMLQASIQICQGRQILSTGSGRPSDGETSTTQEVHYDKVQSTLNSLLLVLRSPGPGTLQTCGPILELLEESLDGI